MPHDPLLAFGLAVACIYGVNLLPAFGPPTWTVLVVFRFGTDVPLAALVLGGALAAAAGRLTLAAQVRRQRHRLGPERLAGLAAARDALAGSRGRATGGLALFALSPLPSAQLFVAAGLLAVPLAPLTCAFFGGRIVSYAIYVGGASAAGAGLGDTLGDVAGSPAGIALQLALLAGLVALVRLDWAGLITRHAARRGRPPRARHRTTPRAPLAPGAPSAPSAPSAPGG